MVSLLVVHLDVLSKDKPKTFEVAGIEPQLEQSSQRQVTREPRTAPRGVAVFMPLHLGDNIDSRTLVRDGGDATKCPAVS